MPGRRRTNAQILRAKANAIRVRNGQPPRTNTTECAVTECVDPVASRDLCDRHYRNHVMYGDIDPLGGILTELPNQGVGPERVAEVRAAVQSVGEGALADMLIEHHLRRRNDTPLPLGDP